ncbi:MAG: magnesium or manganese-dependent protein phosphatase, partial [Actinomycetia bacterium]|nr:magnesium or manganese-dependent protein phosphatase [Actinomycetes bacterium]
LKLDMATCVFGVLDKGTTSFRWSNAGHPPPLLLRRGDATFLEDGAGVVLGTLSTVGAEEAAVDLEEGDVLILYTDGLIERRGESLTVGFDRLARSAAGLDLSSGEAICEHLLATLLPPHAVRADDVAVLVVRVRPQVTAEASHRIAFDPVPESAALTRGFVAGLLDGAGCTPDEIDTATLLVSELVTNVLHHAHPPCSLHVSFPADDVIEISVQDGDRSTPTLERPDQMSEHGRGLLLIDALADDWGIRPVAGGKEVWLKLARQPR